MRVKIFVVGRENSKIYILLLIYLLWIIMSASMTDEQSMIYWDCLNKSHYIRPNGDTIKITSFGLFDHRIYVNDEQKFQKGDRANAQSYFAKLCAGFDPFHKFWFE